MTAEQQTRWRRDVPVSCICEQVWRGGRWQRSVPHPACPWHGLPDNQRAREAK